MKPLLIPRKYKFVAKTNPNIEKVNKDKKAKNFVYPGSPFM